MKISIFGTGYVGLVSGLGFAEMGNQVICADVDLQKIEKLNRQEAPFYEPGLEELLQQNSKSGRISFSADIEKAVTESDLLFIAVGTPEDEDGASDLKYVLQVARQIGIHMNREKLIVNKSTVPVGTIKLIHDEIAKALHERKQVIGFQVVSNPEFLKEGSAISDCLRPNRIVVGCDDPKSKEVMTKLYKPFFPKDNPGLVFMNTASAEMTKYAANAMLATRISFMNELSQLCELVGADIESIRCGIGSDERIGPHFLYAGIGFGGSCFPKDVKALLKTAEKKGVSLGIVREVLNANEKQKKNFFAKVKSFYNGTLSGLHFAVWGLSFKPGTDDLRESPAVEMVHFLLKNGAHVHVHDPVAMEKGRLLFSQDAAIYFVDDPYKAVEGADALIVITEWKSFKEPDFARIKSLIKEPVIFDGRNLYNCAEVEALGFKYFSVGRKS